MFSIHFFKSVINESSPQHYLHRAVRKRSKGRVLDVTAAPNRLFDLALHREPPLPYHRQLPLQGRPQIRNETAQREAAGGQWLDAQMPYDAWRAAVVVHEQKLRHVVHIGQHMRAAAARERSVAQGNGSMAGVHHGLRHVFHAKVRPADAVHRQELLRRVDVAHTGDVRQRRKLKRMEKIQRKRGVSEKEKQKH